MTITYYLVKHRPVLQNPKKKKQDERNNDGKNPFLSENISILLLGRQKITS